ncbi:hypothetical protein Sjap_006163 [Stephania japonica]|uniref:Uncharacterized protein n=1 Tax=Stephania japonica TaxID=461633 RepID=A0AAP0PLR6_9MAGN
MKITKWSKMRYSKSSTIRIVRWPALQSLFTQHLSSQVHRHVHVAAIDAKKNFSFSDFDPNSTNSATNRAATRQSKSRLPQHRIRTHSVSPHVALYSRGG